MPLPGRGGRRLREMMKIVIADDHALFRAGLRRLLEAERDMEVVGEAGTGREAVRLCAELKPDVAVLDFAMPDTDGLEATKQIIAANKRAKVLIITMYDNEEYAIRFLQAGAAGFIIKETSPDELPAALRKVMSGKVYITPSVMEKIALRHHQFQKENPVSMLSDRELQVLIKLARGGVVSEISEDLKLSVSTVKTYKTRILDKLGLRNTSDLTRFAIRYGLIDRF
jgi:two-component system, NarL family, invasion response regulator UvrY